MNIVKIDAVTNGGDWTGTWQDNAPYNDGWAIAIKVYALPRGSRSVTDYGNLGTSSPILSGSISDGTVTAYGQGVITWRFAAAQMAGIAPGTYGVSLIATKGIETKHLVLATLPVLQG